MTRPLPTAFDYWVQRIAAQPDGDTVYVDAWRHLTDVEGDLQDVRRNRPGFPFKTRVIIVNTPEFKDDRAAAQAATNDTRWWLGAHITRLRMTTYGRDDFGRHLADFWVDGERTNTLTQFLMVKQGWPAYVEKKR